MWLQQMEIGMTRMALPFLARKNVRPHRLQENLDRNLNSSSCHKPFSSALESSVLLIERPPSRSVKGFCRNRRKTPECQVQFRPKVIPRINIKSSRRPKVFSQPSRGSVQMSRRRTLRQRLQLHLVEVLLILPLPHTLLLLLPDRMHKSNVHVVT